MDTLEELPFSSVDEEKRNEERREEREMANHIDIDQYGFFLARRMKRFNKRMSHKRIEKGESEYREEFEKFSENSLLLFRKRFKPRKEIFNWVGHSLSSLQTKKIKSLHRIALLENEETLNRYVKTNFQLCFNTSDTIFLYDTSKDLLPSYNATLRVDLALDFKAVNNEIKLNKNLKDLFYDIEMRYLANVYETQAMLIRDVSTFSGLLGQNGSFSYFLTPMLFEVSIETINISKNRLDGLIFGLETKINEYASLIENLEDTIYRRITTRDYIVNIARDIIKKYQIPPIFSGINPEKMDEESYKRRLHRVCNKYKKYLLSSDTSKIEEPYREKINKLREIPQSEIPRVLEACEIMGIENFISFLTRKRDSRRIPLVRIKNKLVEYYITLSTLNSTLDSVKTFQMTYERNIDEINTMLRDISNPLDQNDDVDEGVNQWSVESHINHIFRSGQNKIEDFQTVSYNPPHDEVCAICQDSDSSNWISIKCEGENDDIHQHHFHKVCMSELISHSTLPFCPVCRLNICRLRLPEH